MTAGGRFACSCILSFLDKWWIKVRARRQFSIHARWQRAYTTVHSVLLPWRKDYVVLIEICYVFRMLVKTGEEVLKLEFRFRVMFWSLDSFPRSCAYPCYAFITMPETVTSTYPRVSHLRLTRVSR